eukprot:CAMPEP_0172435734 /NCGR_PEP_ID=MMETSP1064-20121228/71347_1 /TAXON_ID=202472 /ORGANISM="Aulacoseira subarctica , Strain CCAP 1002/5" /LENGTH=327 /DNA_ID=CAMNT_0013184085 /DNA_START=131 /DNA_END=1114 /DNA_ORIENTATION=+
MGKSKAFPQKLHKMLEVVEYNEFQDIVSWQPHGQAFRVNDRAQFVKRILPKYFGQSKFTSFQRQLNLYCFRRLTRTGNDKNAYYHELFRRDQPLLSKQMVRHRIKGKGARAAANPESEPDFGSLQSSEFIVQTNVFDHASTAVGWRGSKDTLEQQSLLRLQLHPMTPDLSYYGNSNNEISAHKAPLMKQLVPLGEEMRMNAFSSAQISGSESFNRSSRTTYQDSFSLQYNQSYYQPDLGSQAEPNPHCHSASASKLYDDAGKQPFGSRRRFTIATSQDGTEHAIKHTNSSSSGNEYDLFFFEDNDHDSLCDFQDEDIASLCSSDWKF